MRFSVLSSGSKANSTYLEAGLTSLLIDCGLSAKELERRMTLLDLRADRLKAILVTHEHSDHVCGVAALSRRYKIPVFANRKTARHLPRAYGIEHFENGVEFSIGDFKISPFSIVHDASDPVGFAIEGDGLRFAQATDLGRITPLVEESLRGANAIVLESNHDEDMLRDCSYPWVLKQRIASTHGHLSNHTASAFLSQIKHKELFHVVLGHLSENSNTPELALKTVDHYLEPGALPSLQCGSVYSATAVMQVGA